MSGSLIRDNGKHGNVFDFLKEKINDNFDKYDDKSKIKIVSAYFTIYAFYALKNELMDKVSEVQFILGEPSSVENLNKKNERLKTFKIQDENINLEDIISQNSIAKECYDWLKSKNVQIKTAPKKDNLKALIHGKMYYIEQSKSDKAVDAIIGSSNFTVSGLGIGNCSNFELNTIVDSDSSKKDLKEWFADLWENNTEDAKKEILSYLEVLYKENSPEQVYYSTLYHLFKDRLDDKENIEDNKKFTETKIWKTLYQFQKDAVKSIIDKLNEFNGCILADSVGLGKTYTALAVAQYFICNRKPRILVVAPKRLENNWKIYEYMHERNIFKDDEFRLKFCTHNGLVAKNIDKEIALKDFDLIIIDEAHNFRNATKGRDGNLSQYEKMMDMIKNGTRSPKVLLLTATPVNTKLTDLKNQLRFITQDDDRFFQSKPLFIPSLHGIINLSSQAYSKWANNKKRTKEGLLESFSPSFINLLDSLSIARSRKQVKTEYKDNLKFPKRVMPKSIYSAIDNKENSDFYTYDELDKEIMSYKLYLFNPTRYLLKDEEKENIKDKSNTSTMTQKERENYLIYMMKMNFFKRLESSIHSFNISMQNTIDKINDRIGLIDRYKATLNNAIQTDDFTDNDNMSVDLKDDEDFVIGDKLTFNLSELNVDKWKRELIEDREQIQKILDKSSQITSERDKKLSELKTIIKNKLKRPNRKLLIFSTFSDTAEYLYNECCEFVHDELHANIALVTGGNKPLTTYGESEYNAILENFSPKSKLGEDRKPKEQIDILIASDCISEGQNLQDCDTVVNYDIHWNPVRLIQRFGRIDRIGSENNEIQMICFWPTEDLDNYMNLSNRVKARMVLADVTGSADDNPLEAAREEEEIDSNYRLRQLKNIRDGKFSEFEDEEEEQSILAQISTASFKTDLLDHLKQNKSDKKMQDINIKDKLDNKFPIGLCAVTSDIDENTGNKAGEKGIIFCLKHKNVSEDNKNKSEFYPYYLLYIKENGEVYLTYKSARIILDKYKKLCLGKTEPIKELCEQFNNEFATEEGKKRYNNLLKKAISSIADLYQQQLAVSHFGTRNGSIPKDDEQVKKQDDLELISWLIVKG